ncbi:PREDICTED: lipase 3-like, partial [Nicrophorus vespilloides]|uniref:Lipase n=1 Tax=Nicrophorus vespilloides TaxID=110193 RepID=A0ABM1MMA6_NICVS
DEIITADGYHVQNHIDIKTEDGYLLTLHRIPSGKNNSDIKRRPSVLLMHGLLGGSADWVSMGPEKSLAYLLADRGFDVWMGNARGTTWSRKHNVLDPDVDKQDYWNFSWHEIGYYDLPRLIDYILENTKSEQLFYVGHSQGTTSFYVMASERPEYNKKIKLAVSLAPVAYVENVKYRLYRLLSNFIQTAEWLMKRFNIYELFRYSEFYRFLALDACKDGNETEDTCKNLLSGGTGKDVEQINGTIIPVIASNSPSGASTKQFLHFLQGIKSGEFKQYDHGEFENLLKYKQKTPPSYNLTQITAPVALYYAKNDLKSDIIDVQRLTEELPNVVVKHLIEYEHFNHMDYLFAIDVVKFLYNDILNCMNMFT